MNESKPPTNKRVLPLTSIITFLGFLDTTLLVPIMALYAAKLGANVSLIGLIIGLYSIIHTPANIFFGRLIDRGGYKVPLVAGLIGDALSMFLYSLCRLPVQLALVRLLHGTSGALVGPATMSIFAGVIGRTRGQVMGIYGISIAAANLIGFGLSGVIVSRLGYQPLFLFGAILLVIGAGLGLWMPDNKRKGEVAIPFGAALQQVRVLAGRRGLRLAYVSIFAQYFTFGGVVTLLPLYVNKFGMEAFHVGMLLAIFSIIFIVAQFPSGLLSDRRGRLFPIIAGLILGIISLVLLPSLTTFSRFAIVMVFYGLGYGLLFPSISALVADHTVAEERGLATGMFHALLTAGVAIGAPIMGWLGGTVGLETGLAVSSVPMLLPLAMALATLKHP